MTTIYEGKDHLLVHTRELQPKGHRHMASHVIVSMEGNIEVFLEDQNFLCRGICIPAGVYHLVKTVDSPLLVFLFETTSAVSGEISGIRVLEEEICDAIGVLYTAIGDSSDYEDFFVNVLKTLGYFGLPEKNIDRRICAALETLCTAALDQPNCQQMADSVSLSQSRFSHLFRNQTGMTFASYLVRQKLLRAFREAMAGASLTEASLAAGFAGSAHFADVSRRVFGLSAGGILRNYRFLKVN